MNLSNPGRIEKARHPLVRRELRVIDVNIQSSSLRKVIRAPVQAPLNGFLLYGHTDMAQRKKPAGIVGRSHSPRWTQLKASTVARRRAPSRDQARVHQLRRHC